MNPSKTKLSEPIYDVKMEFNVKQEMRDGIKLSAEVYRPDAEGQFPVILVRTCYSSAYSFMPPDTFQRQIDSYKFFAQRGYVYVIQDVRGKNDSDGEFNPCFQEIEDGYDSQEWCGTQEWSNGNVGTIGGSYLAWTQILPAPLRNPHVKAMVWIAAPNDPFTVLPARGGAFMPGIVTAWAALTDGRKNQSLIPYEDLQALYKYRPEIDLDHAFGRKIPWYKEWVQHSSINDDYWKLLTLADRYNEIDVPIMHVSGWFDDCGGGVRNNFVGIVKHGRTEETRKSQKLLVGPWLHHEIGRVNQIGAINFGPHAIIDLQTTYLQWFDYWLKGINTRIMDEPPVQLFVMGENRWREEYEWPLARTQFEKYYLHSNGRANSLLGDGVLSTKIPGDEPSDSYTYDPDNPVPVAEPFPFQIGGPSDQRVTERRDDVLVYRTPPLQKEIELTGPLYVKLYAASDVKDTDFTATLVDVFPSGYAMWLNDGIIRARYRDSFEQPTLLEPGKIYEYTIDLWWTSNLFKKGHCIGLEITSSRFPASSPNPNTGRNIGTETQTICAQQTIYHDHTCPSYVLLPIIPRV